VMYYDLPGKRYNITINERLVIGNFTVVMRQLALANAMYLIINDRCQSLDDGEFGDLFNWVNAAKYKGSMKLAPMFDNRTVDVWELIVSDFNLSLCTQQNTPVLLNITSFHDSSHALVIYFSSQFQPGTPSPSLFVPPSNCFGPQPLCPGGQILELDAYIFHPAHMFDLNNENVADLFGDVVFICYDALENHTDIDQFEWVTRWKIQMWSAWGQYAECNRPKPNQTGVCIGAEKFSVGREAPFGIKEMCGQCTVNDDTGTWFSLPTGGECNSTTQPLGPDPSRGQCTWRILERTKTIDGKCLLLTNHLLDTCVKEAFYPFTQSRQVLVNAFASSDLSKGGCPPIAVE